MKRNQKIERLKAISSGKTSNIEKRVITNAEKQARRWSREIALTAKRVLREQGKKQNGFAEEIGVSPQQVNKWLSGKENFTISTIALLSNALGVNLIETNLHKSEEKENIQQIDALILENNRYKIAKKKSTKTKVISLYKEYKISDNLVKVN